MNDLCWLREGFLTLPQAARSLSS